MHLGSSAVSCYSSMRRLMGFEDRLVWEFDVLIQFALKHVGQNGFQLLSRNVPGVFQTALLQSTPRKC